MDSIVLGGAVFFIVPETGSCYRFCGATGESIEYLPHHGPETFRLYRFESYVSRDPLATGSRAPLACAAKLERMRARMS